MEHRINIPEPGNFVLSVYTLPRGLHWLRIADHITSRLAVFAYRCLHSSAPKYLSGPLQRVSYVHTRQRLRSLSSTVLVISLLCCYDFSLDSGVTRICCEEGQSFKLCYGALAANFMAGCSSGFMTNSFVSDAVSDRKICELNNASSASASSDLADYTIFG